MWEILFSFLATSEHETQSRYSWDQMWQRLVLTLLSNWTRDWGPKHKHYPAQDLQVFPLGRNSFCLNREPDQQCTSKHVTVCCPCLIIHGGKADAYIDKNVGCRIEKNHMQEIFYFLLKTKFFSIPNLYIFLFLNKLYTCIYFHIDGTHHSPRKLSTRHLTAPSQRRAAEEAIILRHSIRASERPLKEQIPESDDLLVVKLL